MNEPAVAAGPKRRSRSNSKGRAGAADGSVGAEAGDTSPVAVPVSLDPDADLSALEDIAIEILSVREIDHVLLSIARKALALLEADMSAVLLLEGKELVVRSMIGHRSILTRQARMRAGQGLAGRVLETGEPCKVDSYLESQAISHDFDLQARIEDTRSALGAPLKVRGDVIGVLEVWRRRESLFTERHVRRLVGLANLATIAIENARLYDRQEEGMRELATARESLAEQLRALTEAGSLHRALLQLLLEGEGLPAIARTFASRVGGHVVIFSEDLVPIAQYPRDLAVDELADELRGLVPAVDARTGTMSTALADARWFTVHAIRAGRDSIGWFCLLSDAVPTPNLQIALGEAVLSCALSQLEQRAAHQARAEAREEILWDLLEGSVNHRQSAVSRAERLHIDLTVPHRVVHGLVEDFDVAVQAEGWDAARVEVLRRELRDMAQRVVSQYDAGELVSLRLSTFVAVVPSEDHDGVRRLVRSLRAGVLKILPGVTTVWGVSAAHSRPIDYRSGDNEARIALRAASGMGGDRLALYDELGVVRLILASGEKPDLQAFVHDVIGPLIEHDRKHDSSLAATLRAYFDADCNQLVAAKRIYVHHKTLRYRLDRIEQLTKLDLRRHEDRLRADLALKIHEVAEILEPPDGPAEAGQSTGSLAAPAS